MTDNPLQDDDAASPQAGPECVSRPAWVYVLASRDPDGRWRSYVGWTWDTARRLKEHNSGTPRGARSTRGRQWQIIHAERHDDRATAMSREWHLKRDRALRRRLVATFASAAQHDEW